MTCALQRGQTPTGEFCKRSDQRELGGEALAELLFVIGGARPGLLLRFAVSRRRSSSSTLATKIAASTGVSAARKGRKAGFGSACPITRSRPNRGFRHWPANSRVPSCAGLELAHPPRRRQQDFLIDGLPGQARQLTPISEKVHRAISQVVPSLESLMTTPIAAKFVADSIGFLEIFFARRAAARSEIKPSICFTSTPLACCFRPFHSARALGQENPEAARKPQNALRSHSFPEAAVIPQNRAARRSSAACSDRLRVPR